MSTLSIKPADRARKNGLLKSLVLLFCLSQLYGCLPAVIGGLAGGAELYTERRTLERSAKDNGLEIKLRGVYKQDEMLTDTHLSITVFNGVVLLSGEVQNDEQRQHAEKVAKTYEETRRVVNELQLSGVTSLTSRLNDTIITGKVKSTMVANENVPSTNIKVVTENGVVYLLGLVTEKEGEMAVEVAQTIGGVRKIVKVFEYIDE